MTSNNSNTVPPKNRAEYAKTVQRLPGESQFDFALRTKKEWEELEKRTHEIALEEYKEFIPQLDEEDLIQRISPEQQALDDFIKLIDIITAYNQWAQKGIAQARGRKDSIKVRCPNPQHPDNNPSAWLNTEKNLYNCAKCGGGDVWDIAAYFFNYPVPGYKNDPQSFRSLREQIGRYFGMSVETGIAGDKYLIKSDESAPAPQAVYDDDPVAPVSPVSDASATHATTEQQQPEQLTQEDLEELALTDEIYSNRKHGVIDWKKLVPENTFLSEYLRATTVDDSPEEFHFWEGLLALGMAVGNLRTLEDSPPVSGNLYVCLVGGTGTGKSKSKRNLTNIVYETLPYDKNDQPPHGAQYLKGIQSGEVLVKAFQHEIIDPVLNKPTGKFWPGVKGILDFDELAELINKSSRQGSTLKATLMELYDSPRFLGSMSLSHGIVKAEKPFGSVITTTQFRSIRDLITKKDDGSGFANRWIFATGKPKRQYSINRVQIDLTVAKGLLGGISLATRAHETILWTPEAEKLWDTFFHTVFIPMRTNDKYSSIVQRLDLVLKKLFLLFSVNEKQDQLQEDTVRRVLELYPYLLESYGIVEKEISATQEGDDTELTLRTIQRMTSPNPAERGPTATEIFRNVKFKIASIGKVRKLLGDLVAMGLVEEYVIPPGPKGGRPTKAYKVAPGVPV